MTQHYLHIVYLPQRRVRPSDSDTRFNVFKIHVLSEIDSFSIRVCWPIKVQYNIHVLSYTDLYRMSDVKVRVIIVHGWRFSSRIDAFDLGACIKVLITIHVLWYPGLHREVRVSSSYIFVWYWNFLWEFVSQSAFNKTHARTLRYWI